MPEVSQPFEGKTILVTGGVGAIGSNLVRRLVETEAKKIIILDNLSSSYEWNIPRGTKIQFIRGDVVSDKDLEKAFKDRPQIVYHLAAHFANQNSVDHPELDLMVNGMGVLKILERSHRAGV